MESKEAEARFSSCPVVSSEKIPQKSNPSLIPPLSRDKHDDKWDWLPWNLRKSLEVCPETRTVGSSFRSCSSHFCDLEDEEEIEEESSDVENQKPLPPTDKQEKEQRSDVENQKPLLPADKQEKEQRPNDGGGGVKARPPKELRLSIILLDQGLFTVYKRLFAVCLIVNLTGLYLAIIGRFPYGKRKAALLSEGNILVLILCRSESFLRVVFWLAVKALGRPWVPIRLKTATTSFLQCLGGVHSSCGISSVAWLIYALALTLSDRENTSKEIIAVASAILSLLCLSCLAAFPLVRHLHHNVFERTHRFAGWIALALLWFFFFLTISYDPVSKSYNVFQWSRLLKEQEFWFTLAITLLIILPWATLRRVPVNVTAPSGHASLIKFNGGVEAGILGRISRSPLSEWHAFGIISSNKKEHMMLAGAVGDFTKGLVSDPPNHLWIRGVHFAGLPYLVNLYERVVLVATGSGICVFLSFLLQPCSAEVCLVWVAKGIEQNYGKEIKEMVSGFPEEQVIVHDTAVLGRPKVAEMSIEAAKRWRAQALFVTSNPEGSRDVVSACKAAGIPAFGPIWDS